MLEVQSQPNLLGYCLVSPRTQHVLSLRPDDIMAFEDELTGAIGAAKVEISEATPDNSITIDSEILEASGIGSFEVKVYKNLRPVIPLQNVALGISPISGENMWEIISTARQNVDSLKDIVALCKRRGFIYPGSEIYGGFANTYSYGPYGAQLKKNIKDF